MNQERANNEEFTAVKVESYLKGMETHKITENGTVRVVSRYVSPYTSFKFCREGASI